VTSDRAAVEVGADAVEVAAMRAAIGERGRMVQGGECRQRAIGLDSRCARAKTS